MRLAIRRTLLYGKISVLITDVLLLLLFTDSTICYNNKEDCVFVNEMVKIYFSDIL